IQSSRTTGAGNQVASHIPDELRIRRREPGRVVHYFGQDGPDPGSFGPGALGWRFVSDRGGRARNRAILFSRVGAPSMPSFNMLKNWVEEPMRQEYTHTSAS